MKKIVLLLSMLLVLSAVRLASEEVKPKEGIRLFSTDLSAVYVPSFITSFGQSKSVLPFHDNLSVRLAFQNLIRQGPNLHVAFFFNHLIRFATIMPVSDGELLSSMTAEQDVNSAAVDVRFTFLDFFTLVPAFEYSRNRTVLPDAASADYNFDSLKGSLDLAYETRRSTLSPWYLGAVPIYPDRGFMVAAGAEFRRLDETLSDAVHGIWGVNGKFQFLLGLHEYFTLSLHGSGSANLEKTVHRIAKTSVSTVGSYPAIGDYSGDAHIELRFLHPAGLSFSTPSFVIASQLFKFSPGFVVGYNAGAAGSYGGSSPTFIQSVYVSPLIAIRWNAGLVTVLRFDFAIASKRNGAVFSINFGSVSDGPSSMIAGFEIK